MYQFDDFRPYLYRTADYGKTWTKIVGGIPENAFTRVIREDPARHGLLYTGTELGLFVSFDDGGNWQSLRLNLPVGPIRLDYGYPIHSDKKTGTSGKFQFSVGYQF